MDAHVLQSGNFILSNICQSPLDFSDWTRTLNHVLLTDRIQVLKFNLTESGLLCVLPWLTMAVFANIGGWIADTLVAKGVSITNVRKVSSLSYFLYGFLANVLCIVSNLDILLQSVNVDHAIYWFSWTSPLLDTTEQSTDPSHGGIVHGMQSGLH